MAETSPTPKKTTSVVCETHGLRFNPELHSGCVRCRKEAGESIGGTSGRRGGRRGEPAAAAARTVRTVSFGPGSLAGALGVTLALILLVGFALYFQHSREWEKAQEQQRQWQELMEEKALEGFDFGE